MQSTIVAQGVGFEGGRDLHDSKRAGGPLVGRRRIDQELGVAVDVAEHVLQLRAHIRLPVISRNVISTRISEGAHG